MSASRYLTAEEASRELGVQPMTLYAYVSRGLIRSEPAGERSRRRRYHAEDIRKLKKQREDGRSPQKALKRAFDWGSPLLESGLTFITETGLFYRGRNVAILAQEARIEDVARLLWTTGTEPDPLPEGAPLGRQIRLSPAIRREILRHANLAPIERMQLVLPLLAAEDPTPFALGRERVVEIGSSLLAIVAASAAGTTKISRTVAETLAQAWAPRSESADRLFNTAMILCADHELNASTLAARTAASARASVYGAVLAGLATLQGIRHGGVTERVAAFLQEMASCDKPGEAIAARLKRGENIPGFHHPLYPEGDPRATILLSRLRREFPKSSELALADEVAAQVLKLLGLRPNIDFALVTLVRVLKLPPGSALALFAIGRCVGWIGHAIEQYESEKLIRPRAQYTGPSPDAEA